MGINIVLLGGDKGIDTRMEGGVKVLIVNSSLAGLEQGFKESRPFVMPGSAYWMQGWPETRLVPEVKNDAGLTESDVWEQVKSMDQKKVDKS